MKYLTKIKTQKEDELKNAFKVEMNTNFFFQNEKRLKLKLKKRTN